MVLKLVLTDKLGKAQVTVESRFSRPTTGSMRGRFSMVGQFDSTGYRYKFLTCAIIDAWLSAQASNRTSRRPHYVWLRYQQGAAEEASSEENAVAAALGRLGGLKGGKARKGWPLSQVAVRFRPSGKSTEARQEESGRTAAFLESAKTCSPLSSASFA